MSGDDVPTFGERRPEHDYRRRPGSYGLVMRQGEVLTVEEGSGLFLPGGGHHDGETPRAALDREMLEEVGFIVASARKVAVVDEYVDWRADLGLEKRCHLYRVELGERRRQPHRTDCTAQWMEPSRAVELFYQDAFRWFVRETFLSGAHPGD